MKKRVGKQTVRQHPHILGDQVFAAITAVEGVGLSANSRERLARLDGKGLTQSQKRAAVLAEYRSRKKSR